MTAETLLNQLHKVKHKGSGRYLACCPAHDDKTPSLAVTESADGTILIHCFAGCSPDEILGAVGLEMTDLFPETDQHSFDDRPRGQPRRETRGESNLAQIQVRHLTAEAMADAGHSLTQKEKEQALADYQYLKSVDKLL